MKLIPNGQVYCWLAYHLDSMALTDRDLASALGVQVQSVVRWRKGDVIPPLPMALRVAAYLGVKVESIWRWSAE